MCDLTETTRWNHTNPQVQPDAHAPRRVLFAVQLNQVANDAHMLVEVDVGRVELLEQRRAKRGNDGVHLCMRGRRREAGVGVINRRAVRRESMRRDKTLTMYSHTTSTAADYTVPEWTRCSSGTSRTTIDLAFL